MAKSKFAKFKKEVEKLVLETLKENKRVILPNVGVLIAQGADRLVFNEFIKFNDNVLAKKIAAQEKISQEEALFKLTAFIQELTVELSNHNYFKLGKVGVFTLGSNGKISFFQSVEDAEKFVRKPILDDPDGILPDTSDQEQVIAPPKAQEEPEEAPKPKKRGRPKKVVEEIKKEDASSKKASVKKEEKKIAKVEKNIAKASEAMVSFDIPKPTEAKPKTIETPQPKPEVQKEESAQEVVSEKVAQEPIEEFTEKAEPANTKDETKQEETLPIETEPKPEQSAEKEPQSSKEAEEQPKSLEELGFKNKITSADATSMPKAIEEEPAKPEKGQSAVVIAATVVVLVCLAAIWFLVFQKKSNQQNVTINDITITEELSDESVTIEQVDSLEQALYPTDSAQTELATNASDEETQPENNVTEPEPNPTTETATSAPTAANLQHHVVAGSFSTMAKAQQKVKALKAEGFSAAQVIGERNKMYSVSYGSFATKAEATALLQQVKNTHSGAWYLKF